MHASVSRKRYAWILSFVAIFTIVIVAQVGRDAGPATAKAGSRPGGLPSEDMVNEALGLNASDVAALAFNGGHDGTFSVNVPIDGRSRTLSLAKHSVRSVHYRIKVQHADGSFTFAEPQPVQTYRGHVQGSPGSIVAASLGDEGLHARILMPDGSEFWVEPLGGVVEHAAANAHAIYSADDVIPTKAVCATDEGLQAQSTGAATTAEAGSACGGSLCLAELGCDADFEYYLHWGSVAAVENQINSVVNAMNVQYEGEVAIRHLITTIIIRTAEPDPYASTDPVDLLYEFRAEWLINQGSVQRDVAQLFTGKSVDGNIIGIAWLDAVCTSVGFGVVQSDFNNNFSCATDLSAHELGHNWAAGHCNCSNPPYTMNPYITCANQFNPTLTIPDITSFRDSRSCLSAAIVCTTDTDCDDGLFCTGTETCVGGICQTSGDPCPGQDCHEASGTCVPLICNNDGVCADLEDCNNCPNDCFASSGGVCGNGVCETGAGESCVNCPQDCNGVQDRRPSNRYCCGNGGTNPIGCGDSRCTAGGALCTDSPGTPSCCGDGACEGVEDADNCPKDCAVPCSVDTDCDDGDPCSVDLCQGSICTHSPMDCDDGDACTFDHCVAGTCANDPLTCDDGDSCTDDQCDPASGCSNDFPACGASDGCCGTSCTPATDPDCACGGKNESCASGADCCSGNCKPNGKCR
ncbi:MAG: hypothetical protein IIC02_02250 [Planctomycetes bacterium]|nr:hypothetical protein [Planctomycetota bacterium]